jgi:hypothetical protein
MSVRRTPWTTYLWPGLPQLWSYGSWSGLALALVAAGAFDGLLLGTFGWSELIGQNWRIMCWAALGVVWAAAVGWSISQCRRQAAVRDGTPKNDSFAEATDHYLKGDYYQAEQILEGLLRRNDHDLEARLMLATVLRRTRRCDEAREQLDVLARLEGAGRWELEIQDEQERLTETEKSKATAA